MIMPAELLCPYDFCCAMGHGDVLMLVAWVLLTQARCRQARSL